MVKKKEIIIISILILSGLTLYAAYQNITTTWRVEIPNNPPTINIISPPTNTTIFANTTTFTWSSNDTETSSEALEHLWTMDILPTISSIFIDTNNTGNTTNYTCTPQLDGTYYWRVEVTDGVHVNVSDIYTITFNSHPLNHIPSLTNYNVTPTNGNDNTVFNYTLTYTDLDNESPTTLKVIIDSQEHTLLPSNTSDNNYTDGKEYYYTTTLTIGTHNYTFYVEDLYSQNSTPITNNPFVVDNHWPEITLHNPAHGQIFSTSTIVFNFSIIDLDDNYIYHELWLWKDNGSKQIYNINTNESISLYAGSYQWQIYAVDTYGGNLSEIRTFGVLTTGKQTSVTIQADSREAKTDEYFTGNLVITNEGPMPTYEVYWYLSLYNINKNTEYIYDSGSKALTTSIEVTYSILVEEEPNNYYLIARTYDNIRSTGALLGQDELLVAITSNTINLSELKIGWNSLIYDTPRFILDLEDYNNATQVQVPLTYTYDFLFFSGSRIIYGMEMYIFTNNTIIEIPTLSTEPGVYSFGDYDKGILIIVPNPSPTDCSWLFNWLHKGDVIV